MSTLLQRNQSGPRTCLKCNATFESSHAGNRICKTCTKVNSLVRISDADLQSQRGAKRHNGFDMDLPGSYEVPILFV